MLNMKLICKENKCCGCEGCKNICPVQCISMCKNNKGELHPKIDNNICVNCNLCQSVCPSNNHSNLKIFKKCYAAYASIKDNKKSASGGIAATLYKEFLNKYPGSYIVGVYYDNESLRAKYAAYKMDGCINSFRGSKYVQADKDRIYQKCGEYLLSGHKVLFIGLPCEANALWNYIKLKRISSENLYIVDLLCHGVSPQEYLINELDWLKEKYKWDRIEEISFRSNEIFKNFHLVIKAKKNCKYLEYNRYSLEDPYFYGFLSGITLRESCYSCEYTSLERIGDLTIGDFIGLASNPVYPKYYGKKTYNASLILKQTLKGDELLELCKKSIYIEERDIEEALENGSSLKHPFEKSPERDKFLKLYAEKGFVKSILNASKKIKKNQFYLRIKRIVYSSIIMVRKKIYENKK